MSGPFHHGLDVVFVVAAGLAGIAGLASLLRDSRYIHPDSDQLQQDEHTRSIS
jgi:hypothetical protein